MIRVTANTSGLSKKIKKLTRALNKTKMTGVVRKAAFVTRDRLVKKTPKRWTGQTRRGWKVDKVSEGHYVVYNKSKVMLFLEKGTKGSKPKKAKFLFIPLTRRAFLAGGKGVYAANKAAKEAGGTPKFKFGKDFVLAKKAKGIKPLHIVRDARSFSRITLKAAMRQYIKKSI